MASLGNLPPCVRECWELLHSEAFFLLLSNFTGLRLHYLCPDDDDDDDTKEQNEGLTEQDDTQAGGTSGSLVETAAETSRGKGVCHLHNCSICSCVFSLKFVA